MPAIRIEDVSKYYPLARLTGARAKRARQAAESSERYHPGRGFAALRDVSRVLERTTGWRTARIPGLLHERDFFAFLARRVFPSTDYIRPVELRQGAGKRW